MTNACTMGECVLSFVALLSCYFYGTRVPRLPFTLKTRETPETTDLVDATRNALPVPAPKVNPSYIKHDSVMI